MGITIKKKPIKAAINSNVDNCLLLITVEQNRLESITITDQCFGGVAQSNITAVCMSVAIKRKQKAELKLSALLHHQKLYKNKTLTAHLKHEGFRTVTNIYQLCI